MKNKVISLILVIPLVLMFCVFSASNIISLNIPIAVSNVSLFHGEQEIVNLVENDEFQINAQVYPKNASNKGLIYSYEVLNKGILPEEPIITISKNGLVKALGCGTVKITVTTKDGAYKKSFILEIVSTKATDIVVNLSKTGNIFVGDEFSVLTDVLPLEALDKNVSYTSSNEEVIKIDRVSGECQAISSGLATLTATLQNGIKGVIEKTLKVTVFPRVESSLVSINGRQKVEQSIFSDTYNAVMEINYQEAYNQGLLLKEEDILLDYDKSSVESVSLNKIYESNGIYKYQLTINGIKYRNFNLKASVNYGLAKNYFSELNLTKFENLNELNIKLINFKQYLKLGSKNMFRISVEPNDFINYTLDLSLENENTKLSKIGEIYCMEAINVGENNLTIKVIVNNEIIKTIEQNIEVIDVPTSIYFSDLSKEYGIENLMAVASENLVDGEYQTNRQKFAFTTNVDLKNIEFSSSDESVAVFENDELIIKKDGKITITAHNFKAEALGINVETKLNIRCVVGVNVSNYQDLVKATEEGKQVVLTKDIMLGEKLVSVNEETGATSILKTPEECAAILAKEVKQMKTTADWSYYKNYYGYTEAPNINYIIKFTNNCFGNGFVLNANNITNLVDGTGALYDFAVFRGPLDLVSIIGESFKAQDNIAFIATDNVIIDNVELVGADLNGVDSVSLSQLNHVGTVLEIMGDNVKVVNSRIRNGRNCVRVFGKEYNNYEKINVLIESCLISNAREFLVKMGTNKKVLGEFKNRDTKDLLYSNLLTEQDWLDCSPKIEDYQHLNSKMTPNEYNSLVESYKNDQNYQDLIMTNLTIKNSNLYTSGLFSIGLETSFAGPALDGGKWSIIDFKEHGWSGIAGTSYPTQLNLEGQVNLYDWKKITNLDSSTLIEGDLFNFNIAGMITGLDSKNNEDSKIIYEQDGEQYVHGGIIMYGGGKNYSIVNTENMNNEDFANYTVNLSDDAEGFGTLLELASGREPFRVLMYNKNSEFNYIKQASDFESGSAYDILEKYEF